MQKEGLLSLALLLSACATSEGNTYYQIPFEADNKAMTLSSSAAARPFHVDGRATRRQLWVTQISLADFLAGHGVVYQTNDLQYITARSHLWASPLEEQLQQSLVAYLSAALPETWVCTQAIGNTADYGAYDQVTLIITGFHGRYDGRAIVRGRWLLTHGGRVIRHSFNLALPQKTDGYDALVHTLVEGWKIVGQQLVKEFIDISQ